MFDWDDSASKTAYRIRPAVVDERGSTYLDYTAEGGAARAAAYDVVVQPVTGAENGDAGRQAVLAQYSVTDRNSPPQFWQDSDHVEIDGVEYQVEGHVQRWGSPTGALSHTYMLVNRWEG